MQLSLDKAGYQPASQQAVLQEGKSQTLSFTLREAEGMIRLTGVPRNATAYLDDRPVDTGKPIPVSAGPHRLRVEAADGVRVFEQHRGQHGRRAGGGRGP